MDINSMVPPDPRRVKRETGDDKKTLTTTRAFYKRTKSSLKISTRDLISETAKYISEHFDNVYSDLEKISKKTSVQITRAREYRNLKGDFIASSIQQLSDRAYVEKFAEKVAEYLNELKDNVSKIEKKLGIKHEKYASASQKLNMSSIFKCSHSLDHDDWVKNVAMNTALNFNDIEARIQTIEEKLPKN